MPPPGIVEALLKLNIMAQDMSSEQDLESSSNDSQDSTGSYFSHNSSAHSRASSATSYSSYDHQPKALRSLRDSATITSRRTSSLLSAPRTSWYQNVFKKLPAEVVGCIVSHLEAGHLEGGTPQSFVKDLHSLSLTSRVWDRHVRQHLYVFRALGRRNTVLTTADTTRYTFASPKCCHHRRSSSPNRKQD